MGAISSYHRYLLTLWSAAETAERAKRDKEKADAVKLADERHWQNVEVLNNLQKLLVSER